jgi:hypothetical protein
MSSRTHIINSIIQYVGASRYLEIGVDNGVSFNNILCDYKVGIDPNFDSPATLHVTSDDFFKTNNENFDVIFLDGLHHSEQLERDINNSLNILNDNGIIICHDIIPITYEQQIIPFTGGEWTGDVWKTFVKFRQTRYDLMMFTIDIDMGMGVIMKGSQELINIDEEINYTNFEKRKYNWLNIIPLNLFYINILNTNSYSNILNQYIYNPEEALINFYIGLEYENMGHTASAVSFYLRAAERTNEDLLKYECLLRASICFDLQGSRGNSVIGLLQHAVALLPKRPEAYFLLSRYFERTSKWFDGYMLASIGEKVIEEDNTPLRIKIDYPGYYGLLFEKAINGWWCGLCVESLDIIKRLSLNYIMDEQHKQAVRNNLKNLGGWKESYQFPSFLKEKDQEIQISERDLILYSKKDLDKVKVRFKGIENIERNYSEAFQDFFVLTLLDGKREGYYIEIGAGFPFYGNNTYLLESEFGWKGISLDIETESIERYFQDRENQALLRDATKVDYKQLLKESDFPIMIDYLQLDCDPPNITYDILTKIPFDDYKFRIITYEHDYYQDETKSFKNKSRKYLEKKGYKLFISNVSTNGKNSFEDWWVHPDLIDINDDRISILNSTTDKIKIIKDMFLK